MKLHLGCGQKYLPGYTHIDISEHDHIDIVTDIRDLSMIDNESIDDIYASHVLEHFKRNEIINILTEWNRVLKIGGTIHIAVPNFTACVEQYSKNHNLSELIGLICGGQRDKYDFHNIVFDEELLSFFLKETGFTDIKKYDWKDYLPKNYDDWSRCYLPHMDFENGRSMSLNLVAKKEKYINDPIITSPDLLHAMGIKKKY